MQANPVLEVMHSHGSVRRYLPDPVEPDLVTTIVHAAQRASTSSNLQMWTVVAVTDEAKRQRLSELCGNQAHIAAAPVFPVVAHESRQQRIAQSQAEIIVILFLLFLSSEKGHLGFYLGERCGLIY